MQQQQHKYIAIVQVATGEVTYHDKLSGHAAENWVAGTCYGTSDDLAEALTRAKRQAAEMRKEMARC
jgi:hypothetical protein